MMDATPPLPAVVVGGSDNCGGLGLVRSLGRANIPVIAVDNDASASALHSRFARKFVVSELSGPPLIEGLLRLRADLGVSPVLFMATDDSAVTVSRYRAELQAGYRFRLPDHDCVTALTNKNSFHRLAERYGAPVPRSVRIERAGDLGRLKELRFPCVVKPAFKTSDYLNYQFARAYKVASVSQAEEICCRVLPVLPDVLIQEWIEGGDDEIYFCLVYRGASGNVRSFTGRKLSIWPPDVGTTASCTAATEVHAALEALTESFFRSVSFFGMGSMEFKRDSRTGQFFMIEPTVGRADWQAEVATVHGLNIPLAAYLYEIGKEVPPATEVRAPVIWRDYARHWLATRNRQVVHLSDKKCKIYDAYWRRDDPMPALFHIRHAVAKRLRRALRWETPASRAEPSERALVTAEVPAGAGHPADMVLASPADQPSPPAGA
jgi:predicted ATP-grasp superfamily ATP-dependent carboligase